MSESIRRRSSSRQMLQNLIRVTAQRSREDAEEAERERRRRARERPRDEESSPEAPERSDAAFEDDAKPSSLLVLEEDEGFSDWSHRHEQEAPARCRVTEQRPSEPQWKPEPAEKEQQEEEEQEGQEPSQRPTTSSVRKEVRTSFSSSVFLPPDSRTSYLVAGTMRPGSATQCGQACREEEQEEQEEQEETKAGQRPEDEDDPKHSFTHKQTDIRLERETGREEEPTMSSAENGGGTTEDSEASTSPVLSSSYGPMSPTFKKLLIQFYPDEVNSRVSTEKCTIVERTESLRRSTNSPKKTPPPVAVAKIDRKLEQYTQALEVSSKEGRSGCPALTDLTGPAEPVASKKNLFEALDAGNQSVPASSFKDADGLKVAVADRINQWVRGGEDGSGCPNPNAAASTRDSSTAKKYRFVVTGHSKYEKVSVDGCEDASCQAAGLF